MPIRPGESLSLTVTLPSEQRIEIPKAVVRWSRGQEFAVETVKIEQHAQARLAHYVKRLVLEPLGGVIEMGQITGLQVGLFDRLDRHKAHGGSAHRFADRFRISSIILVGLDVRLHILRVHPFDLMPELFKRPTP